MFVISAKGCTLICMQYDVSRVFGTRVTFGLKGGQMPVGRLIVGQGLRIGFVRLGYLFDGYYLHIQHLLSLLLF